MNKYKARLKRFLERRRLYRNFKSDFKKFRKLAIEKDQRFVPEEKNNFPQLYDKTDGINFDRHYIFHPAWAARVLTKVRPKLHIDISSTLNFCAIVSAFIPVDFYDYRPAYMNLPNLNSRKGDLTALPFPDNSVESISCMHTIEHIGLGRYGDPIDPEGDLKAICELKRVTKPGGTLLFVTPVGRQKIMFNAHRIYSYENILSYFEGFELREFTLIPDDADKKGIILNAEKNMVEKQNYAAGCFWFVKK